MSDTEKLSDAELLEMASAFDVIPYNRRRYGLRSLKVEIRSIAGEPKSWAIAGDGLNLAKDGIWEPEPMNSNKDATFLERCRWSDLQVAIAFAKAHMAAYPSGFMDLPLPKNFVQPA